MNLAIKEFTFTGGQKVELAQGDITDEQVEAIVNAANAWLSHGAGVAGTILRKGGMEIQVESDRWVREHGRVGHDEPAYTSAGKLPCRYVIHAVGPMWGEGREEEKLARCVLGSLQLAERLGLKSMAFPAISTGIFRFPVDLAAKIMLSTIEAYLSDNPDSSLVLVRIVLYDRQTLTSFVDAWERDDHLGA